MLASVDDLTAILIGVGGVLYSVGIAFHLRRTLPFHNAIWSFECWSQPAVTTQLFCTA